ncbi:MAG: dephospho-CoA kinase [Anaerotignaceae bacterium]
MKIIGLTGPTGSGKGEVCQILKEKGAHIIDSDGIAHDIILSGMPAYKELVEYFGDEILDEKGEIVRKKLGAIVFEDRGEKLKFLNQCTHKYIKMEMEEEIKNSTSQLIVIDAPLLLEGTFKELCTEVWVVYAEDSLRLERILKRDNIDEQHGKNRMASQKPWEHYKSHAHVILDNNGDIDTLRKQIEKNIRR